MGVGSAKVLRPVVLELVLSGMNSETKCKVGNVLVLSDSNN